MPYNSTILVKKRMLSCGCFDYSFSKNRCKKHATIESTLIRMSKEDESDNEFPELIKECDSLFSKYIRLKYADKTGVAKCFTCGDEKRWQEQQCGHYVSRSCLYLRWDSRNARVQCKICNELKRGNFLEYTKRLEATSSGISEILAEESRIIYKPTRHELKGMVTNFKDQIKKLQCGESHK